MSLTTLTFSQTLSGRGDKDVQEISEILPGKWADKLDWRTSSPLLTARLSLIRFHLADIDSNANTVQG